jgi:hypothetical protein
MPHSFCQKPLKSCASSQPLYPGALKARRSKAQGGRVREAGSGTLGSRIGLILSPVGATETVPPLQGLIFILPTQGFGRFAASALGFAVPRFQRFSFENYAALGVSAALPASAFR